jgi:hypothetical protein
MSQFNSMVRGLSKTPLTNIPINYDNNVLLDICQTPQRYFITERALKAWERNNRTSSEKDHYLNVEQNNVSWIIRKYNKENKLVSYEASKIRNGEWFYKYYYFEKDELSNKLYKVYKHKRQEVVYYGILLTMVYVEELRRYKNNYCHKALRYSKMRDWMYNNLSILNECPELTSAELIKEHEECLRALDMHDLQLLNL